MPVRVRIAPSPTGPLHIGTARTALFNYFFAKKEKGEFILRIEDTDKKRSEKHFEIDIKEALKWLGIIWDHEARQSERTELYTHALERLLKEHKIYWCPHTEEQLSIERESQMHSKQAPRHVCEFRNGEKNSEQKGILRFKNDSDQKLVFSDIIRGMITFTPSLLGDFSVAKAIDEPLYNFAATIDDADMNITHIIRGEDHIPNTPKQILIQKALGLQQPFYAHLPLILGQDRSKLSKRHGATAVIQYKKEGYLSDAFINFLALLGWHPPETADGKTETELFSREELISLFSLPDVQKGGAIFDIEKLNWLNGAYIRKMPGEALSEALYPYLKPNWQKIAIARPDWWRQIAILEQTRLVTLENIAERVDYFFEEPVLRKETLLEKNQNSDEVKKHLEHALLLLIPVTPDQFDQEMLEKKILPYAEQEGKKNVLWPFRVALTGKAASAGLFEVAELLGKDATEKRLHQAITLLSP